MKTVVVDTGPLVALVNPRDQHHRWAKATFSANSSSLLTCEAVLAESFHLLGSIPRARATLLQLCELQTFQSAFHFDKEQSEILTLLKKYDDTPMDFADACLVRMAETTRDAKVWTIDSDFRIYRLSNRRIVPVLAPWD